MVVLKLALQPLHRGGLSLTGGAPRCPEVEHHHPAAVGGERAVAATDEDGQPLAGLRRGRLLAVGERLIDSAIGRLVGNPIDQQPEEGGAEERGEDRQEWSFHEHRKGRGPGSAAASVGEAWGWLEWRADSPGDRRGRLGGGGHSWGRADGCRAQVGRPAGLWQKVVGPCAAGGEGGDPWGCVKRRLTGLRVDDGASTNSPLDLRESVICA